MFKNDKIESMFQNWKVTIDTYEFVVASPPICLIYSRIRAPFTTTSDFTFRISRKNIFDRISEKLLNSNIVTDELQFDKNFVIKSNSENNVKKLLNDRVRKFMLDNFDINIEISNDKTVIGKQFPNNYCGLSLVVEDEIKDKVKLRNLYNLFGEVLVSLLENGLIEDTCVDVNLK